MARSRPRSTLFPYTTLFRSARMTYVDAATDLRIVLAASEKYRALFALIKATGCDVTRSEEHTSELQSRRELVCRLLLEKNNKEKSGCAAKAGAYKSSCNSRL